MLDISVICQRDVLLFSLFLEHDVRSAQERSCIVRLDVNSLRTALYPCHFKHLVYKVEQILTRCLDVARAPFKFRFVLPVFRKYLGVSDDSVHRRSYVVAHVQQKCRLCLVCSLGSVFRRFKLFLLLYLFSYHLVNVCISADKLVVAYRHYLRLAVKALFVLEHLNKYLVVFQILCYLFLCCHLDEPRRIFLRSYHSEKSFACLVIRHIQRLLINEPLHILTAPVNVHNARIGVCVHHDLVILCQRFKHVQRLLHPALEYLLLFLFLELVVRDVRLVIDKRQQQRHDVSDSAQRQQLLSRNADCICQTRLSV